MHIDLPVPVKKIISALEDAGFEAYAVGGCVRDSIMGVTPHDWDLTTSALPNEVKSCFKRTFDTGIEHGTVTVRMDGDSFEVTTYRVDGDYEDGRHPNDVTFTRSLGEDLKRRDFTVNAMAYSDRGGLVDLFGGCDDIASGIIRCVGDPEERFGEDALRMLRALRFSAQLDFKIEENTLSAIRKLAPTLSRISAERITSEMMGLILSKHPERMEDASVLGLTKVFFPEWDDMMATSQNHSHHCYDVGHHTIEVMRHVRPDKVMRLSAMLHDVAKPVCKKTDPKGEDHFVGHPQVGADMARDIMHRFKLDNATIDDVVRLVRHHDERPAPTKRNIRRLMSRVGAEHMPGYIELKRADIYGQSDYKRSEKLAETDEIERLYKEIIRDCECVTTASLAVTGRDVIEAGVKKGPEVGRALKYLLEVVIEDPAKNERDILLEELKKNIAKFLLICLVILFSVSGFSACGSADDAGAAAPTVSVSRKPGTPKSQVEKQQVQEAAVDTSDIYIVQLLNTKKEKIFLRNLYTGREYVYKYSLLTDFLDKYGQQANVTWFGPGKVVNIEENGTDRTLDVIRASDEVWTYDEIVNYDIDEERGVLRIAGNNYRINADTLVFSKDVEASFSDIEEGDIISVIGLDKDILTVTITTGHGYLMVINTENFDGSLLCVGTEIYARVTEDMTLTVPEGKYKVTAANKGYGGTKKVKIKRGETTVLDLKDLEGEGPKYCKLVVKSSVEGATILLDGNEIKEGKKNKVPYGRHTLTISVEGYDTWTRTLFVNSKTAEITVDPTQSGSSDEGDEDTVETGDEEKDDIVKSRDTDGDGDYDEDDAQVDYLSTINDMLSSLNSSND